MSAKKLVLGVSSSVSIYKACELARMIRKQEEGGAAHQPLIALTAHSLNGDRERFLNDGFDGYVTKPVRIEQLLDELKRVCP